MYYGGEMSWRWRGGGSNVQKLTNNTCMEGGKRGLTLKTKLWSKGDDYRIRLLNLHWPARITWTSLESGCWMRPGGVQRNIIHLIIFRRSILVIINISKGKKKRNQKKTENLYHAWCSASVILW